MKKQFRLLVAALLFMGALAGCDQSDVDDLTIDTIDAKLDDTGNTGGGAGGDPKDG